MQRSEMSSLKVSFRRGSLTKLQFHKIPPNLLLGVILLGVCVSKQHVFPDL